MLNHCAFMGRMTKDPELRQTATGTSVCSFSIACERDFSASDGERGVDYIDCVAWRGTGEFINRNFRKGAMICVVGRLQIRKWKDRDGNSRYNAEIVVDNAYFTGEKRERAAAAQPRVEADDYRDGTQAAPEPQQQYELARKTEYTCDISRLASDYPQTVRIADDGDYDDGDGELPF